MGKIKKTLASIVLAGAVSLGLAGRVEADFVPDRLFVSNYGVHQVLELDKFGNKIREIGVGENPNPRGIAFGPDLNLYVANSGTTDAVNRYNDLGQLVQVIGSGYLDFPTGLDFGPNNHLYVSSWGTNQIVEFDSSGNFVKAFDSVIDPQDVAVDSSGNIYVPDYYEGVINYNPRVIKYNPNGEILATFGGIELHAPFGIEVGPNGNIFVGNQFGGQGEGVYEYNAETFDFIRKIDDEHLDSLTRFAFDLENNLYISDFSGNEIVAYDFDGNYLRTLSGFDRPYGLSFSPIPEPATMALFGSGLVGIVLLGKYKKKK